MRMVTYLTQYDSEGGRIAPLRVLDPYLTQYTEWRFSSAHQADWLDCRSMEPRVRGGRPWSCLQAASALFKTYSTSGRALGRSIYGCWPDYREARWCAGIWQE